MSSRSNENRSKSGSRGGRPPQPSHHRAGGSALGGSGRMESESSLAQGWVDDPPPQSRCPVRAWLCRGGHPSALSSLCGPSLSASGKGRKLLCPLLTAAPGSARLAPALSPLPWPAPSQDATQLSPDKTMSGHCTSATFTRSPGSPDFGVLCHLVPGQ
jgi:hypothetical protein